MTHGSLFSGIGGFDLAARWAGWDNLFNCEIDLFCKDVLKYHFPDAEQYGDIKTTDFAVWRDRIDVLSGGFPCQPFSQAGKRKGTEDDRYLWPEMLGVIRSVRPRWVVGENVLGIVNWSKGLVFEQVCSDLEAEGYEVQPFVIPACGVNAPHRRYRTWFVARFMENSGSLGCCGQEFLRQQPGRTATVGTSAIRIPREWEAMEGNVAHRSDARLEDVQRKRQNTVLSSGITSDAMRSRGVQQRERRSVCIENGECPDEKCRRNKQSNGPGRRSEEYVADTNCKRLQRCKNKRSVGEIRTEQQKQFAGSLCPHWQDFPTQSPVCSRNDGLSYRLDGITFPKWRKESIKAYGNAIVPQVAYRIFETINEYENYHTSKFSK